MRGKRKRKAESSQREAPREPKPPGVATAFGPLLERAGLHRLADSERTRGTQAKRAAEPARTPQPGASGTRAGKAAEKPLPPAPAPEPELSQRELSLLHRAYQGVQRIDRPKAGRVERDRHPAARPGRAPDGEEAAARARLSDLVGGGVRFEVRWEDGFVAGLRAGQTPKLLARLRGGGFAPEAELDLHGLRRADVARAVTEFVRAQRRLGRRYLLIITGKGQHSEGGVGVLGEALAEALARSGAAPLVLAFASAHAKHGGQGAVAVMLE